MNSPNRRILLVDDNASIHADFRKIFCPRHGRDSALNDAKAALFGEPETKTPGVSFEVDSAMQGEEGLKLVKQAMDEGRPYAMAFVDVRMPPGWDGIETTEKIWQHYPDLQVVICTAYSDYSWDDMIEKIGQSDRLVILKKPFDNVEALQLAHALTAKWQLLQDTRSHVTGLEERVRERTAALEMANATLQAEIADRNKLEVRLRHTQKMESIGQLAAGIAHEINTPTQYIGDNTRFLQGAFADIHRLLGDYDRLYQAAEAGAVSPELLASVKSTAATADVAYLGEEIPKAIEQSLQGVQRVSKIVGSMKEFSHPGTGEKTAVDLNRAIESTITVATNEWRYVATMVTDLDATLPPVHCLPGEFNQVILNMVVNASHAIADVVGDGSKGKGTITVSTRRDGDWVEVRIGDTGTGIPDEIRKKIFDPFFTTKGVGKGTGQGLAIAHSVTVDKHGGFIEVESQVGKGSTFIIRLPICPVAAKKAA